jgi:hypothetical protein
MPSNLPPGVSVNMIPGNRPEDDAEERFWDQLYGRLLAEGHGHRRIDFLMDNVMCEESAASRLTRRAIELARDLGYEQGVADGRMEEQMDRCHREQERWEQHQEGEASQNG